MIECSNCKELIGDNMEQCPFCLHPVSEEVRAAYMEKQEEVKAIQAVMKSYASRVRKSIIIGIVIAVIVICCCVNCVNLVPVTNVVKFPST